VVTNKKKKKRVMTKKKKGRVMTMKKVRCNL
jgi:hypothetical protein